MDVACIQFAHLHLFFRLIMLIRRTTDDTEFFCSFSYLAAMPLILHIDTAVGFSSVCLADNEKVLGLLISPLEKESASWLHIAIKDVLVQTGCVLQELSAIAISAGPGSYTGLRVGMAAAKGLCYGLSLPLISIHTLQMMAASLTAPATNLLCPMIDARRMEVFTALYTASLDEVMPATPVIIDPASFATWLEKNTITFFGNGSIKAVPVLKHPNALFSPSSANALHMVKLAAKSFEWNQFSELAYTEPLYGKGFYAPISKKIY